MRHDQQHGGGTGGGSRTPPVRNSADAPTIPFAQRLTCTIAEACEATGLGRTKFYELIGEGRLDTTTIGRRRLVLVRSLRTRLEAKDARVKT
jgi:excisionase family DNA binding protein